MSWAWSLLLRVLQRQDDQVEVGSSGHGVEAPMAEVGGRGGGERGRDPTMMEATAPRGRQIVVSTAMSNEVVASASLGRAAPGVHAPDQERAGAIRVVAHGWCIDGEANVAPLAVTARNVARARADVERPSASPSAGRQLDQSGLPLTDSSHATTNTTSATSALGRVALPLSKGRRRQAKVALRERRLWLGDLTRTGGEDHDAPLLSSAPEEPPHTSPPYRSTCAGSGAIPRYHHAAPPERREAIDDLYNAGRQPLILRLQQWVAEDAARVRRLGRELSEARRSVNDLEHSSAARSSSAAHATAPPEDHRRAA